MSNHYRPRRELISTEQFAEECGVCSKTIRRMIHDGQLPAYRVGRRAGVGLLRLDRRDVDLVVRRARPEEVSP